MQITESQKLILLAGGVVLLLLINIMIFAMLRSPIDKYLIPEEDVPVADWERVIEIEETGEMRIFTNRFDGYRVAAPVKWDYSEEVRAGNFGLVLAYGQDEHEEDEEVEHPYIDEGLAINILVIENPEGLALVDWISAPKQASQIFFEDFVRLPHSSYDVLTSQVPLEEELWFGAGEFIDEPIADTLAVKYLLRAPRRDNIYLLLCTIYNDVDMFLPECEKLLDGFEIL